MDVSVTRKTAKTFKVLYNGKEPTGAFWPRIIAYKLILLLKCKARPLRSGLSHVTGLLNKNNCFLQVLRMAMATASAAWTTHL